MRVTLWVMSLFATGYLLELTGMKMAQVPDLFPMAMAFGGLLCLMQDLMEIFRGVKS